MCEISLRGSAPTWVHCFTVIASPLFPRAPLGPGGAQGRPRGPTLSSPRGEPEGPSPLTGDPADEHMQYN